MVGSCRVLFNPRVNKMSSNKIGQEAKKLVSLLEKFPKDRIQHNATFKTSQIIRFCNIGGIAVPTSVLKEGRKDASSTKSTTKIDATKIKETLSSDKDDAYQKDLFTIDILSQQFKSLKNIANSKWEKYYQIDNKLLEPKGNPNYYNRLLGDLDKGGKQKEGFLTAWRTILTGKY